MDIQIDVERFFTKYVPDPNEPGKMIGVDYVVYGPFGALDRTKIVERVSRVSAVQGEETTDNLAVQLARLRWNAIEPRYEAWKAGREMPVDGTPIAAFNAVTPEDAEIFKLNRIYTVEQLAALPEAMIQKLALPNARAIKDQAALFLANADRSSAALAQKEMRDTAAALQARVEELEKALAEKKRGPGRPPKAEPVEADEEVAA